MKILTIKQKVNHGCVLMTCPDQLPQLWHWQVTLS